MDPNTMDSFTKHWWYMGRLEIIPRRRLARFEASGTVDATRGGGDDAMASDGAAGVATDNDSVA
jgi:hypothetical protein